uniref:YEATS domain-containing protein n=1 Tax=Calcidiscus leptoporus TaxID=127549 RepID=A0A7S0P1E7_9EUKA
MVAEQGDDTLSKAIAIGSCAYWLGKRAEESKSHEWTVYVRAIDPDEDAGVYIKKIVFQLHPSFNPATRVIEAPPFEVTEQGWGEFEIQLQIFFHDSHEKPLELSHLLKLYPDVESTSLTSNRPVVSERYDEVVFQEPSAELRQRLTATVGPSVNGWRNSPHAKWYTTFDVNAQQEQLQAVYQLIAAELQNASKRRVQCEEELKSLRAELSTV